MKQSSNVFLLGNIGYAAVDYLDKIKSDDVVILELSSFQLQDLDKSPHIAVITNMGEDHLNYHKDLVEYWESKSNILKYQTNKDFAVINQDYLSAIELAVQTSAKIHYFSGKNRVEDGAYLKEISFDLSEVVLTMTEIDEDLCSSDELKIVGNHNMQNVAASAIVGRIMGVDTQSIHDAVVDFQGLEHRLEHVAEINGVDYYNDSYATNPISTGPALKAFQRPIIAILGGSEKGIDYTGLVDEIMANNNIKAIVYIGETGEKIAEILKDKNFQKTLFPGGQKIEEIVAVASDLAKSGDVVVLSPASASFGLFKNYKDRGEQFKRAVNSLNSKL
jgi:UDP-N-acetylmuramoylalanine--D-glutamate ligase